MWKEAVEVVPVYGHGEQSIYVYYFPRDYDPQLDQWPCKVGSSRHSALDRIQQQVKTASPEKPVVGLVVKCSDGYRLEHALHAILKLYHCEIEGATGAEWFRTSPETVLNLCRMLRMV